MTNKTQTFTDKAKQVHGGYYSYENTVYEKSNVKVEITCPEHGSFWQVPNAHLNGSGCVKCRYKKKPDNTLDPSKYSLSSRDSMINYIIDFGLKENTRAMTARKHKPFMNALKGSTSFLDEQFDSIPNHIRLTCYLEAHNHVPICKNVNCDNSVNLNKAKGQVFTMYCSYACSRSDEEVKKKISKANSDSSTVKKKRENTKKYYQDLARSRGYDNPESYTHSSHFPDIVEKRKETMNKNWESGHPMRDSAFTERRREAFFNKWGVYNPIEIEGMLEHVCKDENGEWFISREDTKQKIRKTHIERYGRYSATQSHISEQAIDILQTKEKFLAELQNQPMYKMAQSLGVHYSTVCRAADSLGVDASSVWRNASQAEHEIMSMLSDYGIACKAHYKLKDGKEIDLYIPSHRLGIEYNGVYWHSAEYKNKNYHQEKTLNAKKEGIDLIHVWEDDWNNEVKQPIVINKILSKLNLLKTKIGARKTSIAEIDYKQASAFYESTHIQGKTSPSLNIGLMYNGYLVACMSMKRKDNDGTWELTRYSTMYNVQGGMGKCLKYFKDNYFWNRIITFAHLDYSNGNLYDTLGFGRIHITRPTMWYVKKGEWVRLNRRNFQKKHFKDKLDVVDMSKTEIENMKDNGYITLYDAGMIKYELNQ